MVVGELLNPTPGEKESALAIPRHYQKQSFL
jgi:hypothetical protein